MGIFRMIAAGVFIIAAETATATPLIDIITKCYPAKELEKEIRNEKELRKDLQKNDFRLRMLGGYSKNEISQNNPERLQLGLNLRWEDLTDNQRRKELQGVMGDKKEQETKYLLENFWRMKIKDFYFWKWGKTLQNDANALLNYALSKLSAGEESFTSLSTTQYYSDLLDLHRISSEFKGKMDSLNINFANCPGLNQWNEKLDFEYSEIVKNSAKRSTRTEFYANVCESQKKIKSITLEREAGLWEVALNTSYTRNQLLNSSSDQFNDVRVGFEITIPISGAKAHKVIVDACDYETNLIENEDQSERSSAESLYPVLNTLQRQFKEIKKKVSRVTKGNLKRVPTRDLVQLGLNLFSVHASLSTGEAKMNAGILPAKIVAHEL